MAQLHEVSPLFLIELLQCFESNTDLYSIDESRFDSFSIKDILIYLYKTHNLYESHWFKRLERALLHCMKLEGVDKKLSSILIDMYSEMKDHLTTHMRLEEDVLFPYAECLLKAHPFDNDRDSFFANPVEKCFAHAPDEIEYNVFNAIKWLVPSYFSCENTTELMNLETEFDRFLKELQIHNWVESELLNPKIEALRNTIFSCRVAK